jgi:hypothetical protein
MEGVGRDRGLEVLDLRRGVGREQRTRKRGFGFRELHDLGGLDEVSPVRVLHA